MSDMLSQAPQHVPVRSAGEEDAMSIEELKQQLTAPPSATELARRRAVYERIVAHRREVNIAPLTTADLVHQAREEEARSHEPDR